MQFKRDEWCMAHSTLSRITSHENELVRSSRLLSTVRCNPHLHLAVTKRERAEVSWSKGSGETVISCVKLFIASRIRGPWNLNGSLGLSDPRLIFVHLNFPRCRKCNTNIRLLFPEYFFSLNRFK